ncbi:MAG TPA: sugar phosphate isomerase/epimerase [Chloroflexota bacterium]|nr:sugar phosphate isomerase/epimerase [Chloroflexota bacterium]
MAQPRIGLQMYTVREAAQRDFPGTVRQVAAIGYPAIQFAGYGNLSATEMKSLLDELNLAVAGSHVGFEALRDNFAGELEYNLAVGNRDLIVPMMPNELRSQGGEKAFHQMAAWLDEIGERCRQNGARLSYHNHALEFEPIGSRTGMEILLDETDPDLVKWEPDVYWIAYANQDPATWIRKYGGRQPFIHLKDMTADASRTFAEVGEGIIDFAPIFAASEAQGAEWYVVEQDRCARSPFESIALSLQHLKEWGKV